MKSNLKDPKSQDNNSIIDKSGNPFQKSPSLWDRWKKLSKRIKIIVISIAAFATLLATFLTNLEIIKSKLNFDHHNDLLPKIIVKLSNSSKVDVTIAARGDFILWFPGPDAYHTFGKYEFHTIDNKSPSDGSVIIRPAKTVTLFAIVLNKDQYSKILSRADCDLNLLIYRAGASLINTNNIPFTKDALNKYYIEADVGKL